MSRSRTWDSTSAANEPSARSDSNSRDENFQLTMLDTANTMARERGRKRGEDGECGSDTERRNSNVALVSCPLGNDGDSCSRQGSQ
jgi:hypothetical protein